MYEMLIAELRSCCCFYGEGCLDCSANGHCRSQMENKAADAIEKMEKELAGLRVFEQGISKLPDCNTCLKKEMCEFMPRYGAYCRINCPHWLGEQHGRLIDADALQEAE